MGAGEGAWLIATKGTNLLIWLNWHWVTFYENTLQNAYRQGTLAVSIYMIRSNQAPR